MTFYRGRTVSYSDKSLPCPDFGRIRSLFERRFLRSRRYLRRISRRSARSFCNGQPQGGSIPHPSERSRREGKRSKGRCSLFGFQDARRSPSSRFQSAYCRKRYMSSSNHPQKLSGHYLTEAYRLSEHRLRQATHSSVMPLGGISTARIRYVKFVILNFFSYIRM